MAQPADAMAVAHLHVRAWQAAYRGLLFDEYLDALDPAAWATRYTFGDEDPAQPATLLALDDGEQILGFATFGPSRDADRAGAGELLALYVDPDRWRGGIGRTLIAGARGRLAELGFEQASLWVLAGNERAENFYQRDGWTADGTRRPAKVAGISVEDLRYSRSLR